MYVYAFGFWSSLKSRPCRFSFFQTQTIPSPSSSSPASVASTSMEQLAPTVNKFAESTKDFFAAAVLRLTNEASAPIEILKRVRREAFADLVKIWDRQATVQKPVSVSDKFKGVDATRFRGELDLLAAAFFVAGSDEEDHSEQIERGGIRTGMGSRFKFESRVRGKDSLVVELMADRNGKGFGTDGAVSSVSLSKLYYKANICGWLSGIAIPVGAQFRDVSAITKRCSSQDLGLTDMSFTGPPLLNQDNGSAIGLMVRKSNVTTSLARSVSGMGMQKGFDGIRQSLCTFAQVVYELPKGTKFSLMGVHQVPSVSTHHVHLGPFVLPVGNLKRKEVPQTRMEEASAALARTHQEVFFPEGAIALRLESSVHESKNLEAWVEMKNIDPLHLRWSVNVSDTSEAALGWGISVAGIVDGPVHKDRVQIESHLQFKIGKNFSLIPKLAYVMEGGTGTVAVMLGSNWSL